MKVSKTKLDGVLEIEPPTIFEDFRGEYVEIYNDKLFKKNKINLNFIQDDYSASRKNVLRGIHGDKITWKLISCFYGKFYLVIINNDIKSPQYKKWISFTLSQNNKKQILVPPKFGNGHLVVSDYAIFHYKQTTEYNREGQFTIHWDDPEYNIWWPIEKPILSHRDKR